VLVNIGHNLAGEGRHRTGGLLLPGVEEGVGKNQNLYQVCDCQNLVAEMAGSQGGVHLVNEGQILLQFFPVQKNKIPLPDTALFKTGEQIRMGSGKSADKVRIKMGGNSFVGSIIPAIHPVNLCAVDQQQAAPLYGIAAMFNIIISLSPEKKKKLIRIVDVVGAAERLVRPHVMASYGLGKMYLLIRNIRVPAHKATSIISQKTQ